MFAGFGLSRSEMTQHRVRVERPRRIGSRYARWMLNGYSSVRITIFALTGFKCRIPNDLHAIESHVNAKQLRSLYGSSYLRMPSSYCCGPVKPVRGLP